MKKQIKLFSALLLALCLAASCSIFALEAVEPTATSENASAVLSQTITPGVNLVTGTTAPEDFESWSATTYDTTSWANQCFRFGGDFAAADIGNTATNNKLAGVEGGDGMAACFRLWTDKTKYSVIHINNSADTTGRKYHIEFDVYSDVTDLGSTEDTTHLWIMDGWSKIVKDVTDMSGVATTDKVWKHVEADEVFSDAGGVKIQLQSSATNPAATARVHIDNLLVTPYFKITYKTGAEDVYDWVLFDENGNIVTHYIPNNKFAPNDKLAEDGETVLTCAGWALNENSPSASPFFQLAGDITLYPVWKELEPTAVDTVKRFSLRTVADSMGMRFPGYVSTAIHEIASEYGAIVALRDDAINLETNAASYTDVIHANGLTAIPGTSAFTNSDGLKIARGVAYDSTTSTDFTQFGTGAYLGDPIYENKEGHYFTAAVVGIPENKDAYNTIVCVRTYIVIDGETFYGAIVEKSLAEVAELVKASDAYAEGTDTVLIETVDSILSVATAE